MWILKQPVLFDWRVTLDCFKVIVEPDLVAEDGIVEVEIVSRESGSINKDDTSTITDVSGGYA